MIYLPIMQLTPKQLQLQKQMLSPFKFGLFKLAKVPMAFIAGIKLKGLDTKSATTLVRYRFINTNPFKSMYFAVLAMAAEMSTGALALFSLAKHKQSIALIVVSSKGTYYKKAVGKIRFECTDGEVFIEKIDSCLTSGNAEIVKAKSIGYNEAEEVVCEYEFEWSFKLRSKK